MADLIWVMCWIDERSVGYANISKVHQERNLKTHLGSLRDVSYREEAIGWTFPTNSGSVSFEAWISR